MKTDERIQQETWRTSVTELMLIFRSALVSLVPSMEQARIAWREPEAYDDWDDIAATLYHNIVVRSLQWSELGDERLTLPEYGLVRPQYSGSVIVVDSEHGRRDQGLPVFVGFSTRDTPFDRILRNPIQPDALKSYGKTESLPIEGAKFELIRLDDGERKKLHSLAVEL